ncbi:DinB family protein [Plantactinospora endophytica]|uniref:DinB family protein n=1 Tax=Plantactinospora endophytica TaxID=673535 RepID=A0ABQ4E354_9ACTN|nr:DinB family protein [Plantactinospora endophytica]GIG88756.1 hypothetical protein Pen02_36920 [Plantactinospora endophytica]
MPTTRASDVAEGRGSAVHCLAVDEPGTIWVGYFDEGIYSGDPLSAWDDRICRNSRATHRYHPHRRIGTALSRDRDHVTATEPRFRRGRTGHPDGRVSEILGGMRDLDAKANLHRYLREAREALLGKLEGLSEYDVRRPLVPTGTNLLGLVKHVASVTAGYFGEVFDRPYPEPVAGLDEDAEPNADMWATADESRDDIIGLWHRVWAHADATIETLPIDAPGSVRWWGHTPVTLHLILVHVLAELNRHAGHADIVRELVDGQVGWRRPGDDVVEGDEAWWAAYRERLESTAREFA